MRKIRISLAISLALVVVWSAFAVPITITVTGSWSPTVDGTDFAAGTDFAGDCGANCFDSATDQITIEVGDTGGSSWTVNISRDTESSWPSGVGLYAQRTDDDDGTNGTTYKEVTGTDGPSFSGNGDNTSITVQLKFEGISVDEGPSTYSTTVYYTVTA